MRRLSGQIPRTFENHRTPEGHAYGSYCRIKQSRLGPFPPDVLPTLREAALIATCELPKLQSKVMELEVLLKSGGNAVLEAELRRCDRKRGRLRLALKDLEAKLEQYGQNRAARPSVTRPRCKSSWTGCSERLVERSSQN